MTTGLDGYHDFFLAMAGVIGALIGLLFVAITVTQDRAPEDGVDQRHGLRAASALTAFTNVLTASLFGLVPGFDFGATVTAIGAVGLTFVADGALGLRRYERSWALARDAGYLRFRVRILTRVHLS